MIGCVALGGSGEDPWIALLLTEALNAGVELDRGEFAIVQSGAAQLFIVQVKPQWFDEMERAACIGAQSNNIACVGRNLRLKQNDFQHSAGDLVRVSV